MAGVGSSLFFKTLLVVIVTFISAAKGEEPVTVFTLKTDPDDKHIHTSEQITGTREFNEEFHRKNMVLDLIEKVGNAKQQDENSTFEEDISEDEDFGSTSGNVVENMIKNFSVRPRTLMDGPKTPCKPNEKRDRQGNCRKESFSWIGVIIEEILSILHKYHK